MVAFVISHFLPAYGEDSGFACFRECWEMLLGRNTEIFSQGWCYYSGFVIANIVFIRLVVALFVTWKGREFLLVMSILCFLQVLSWVVLHIFEKGTQIREIKIGYYVWLIAYGLLMAAHLRKRESLESMSVERSVV